MEEVWEDVKNYEGLYQVSNLGRVKSLKRKYHRKDKILKPNPEQYGYLHVRLYKNLKYFVVQVSRLVAQAFIPNPNNLETVNHKDGIKKNNNVSNLEWLSIEDNQKHWVKNLNCKGQSSLKLSKRQILAIRRINKSGRFTQWELAKRFLVNQATISRIITGRIWEYV